MQWKIPVRVIPGSKADSMEQDGKMFKIKLRAPAVDGKANTALKQYVAKQCGLRKSAVSIITGEKSRNKIISITADTAPEIYTKISVKHELTGRNP